MNKLRAYQDITNTYSFNFRKFREFKKKLHRFMIEKYGEDIVSKIFANKEVKEAFYKYILGFSGQTDIFNSGRKKDIEDFELDKSVKNVIYEVKQYVMKTLYENDNKTL